MGPQRVESVYAAWALLQSDGRLLLTPAMHDNSVELIFVNIDPGLARASGLTRVGHMRHRYHAWICAGERGRRAGVPCLVDPMPALRGGSVVGTLEKW